VDIFLVMAQGFKPCRLQRYVQGFCTELYTGAQGDYTQLHVGKNRWEIIHKGKPIKK
jgi:hypothetical protein